MKKLKTYINILILLTIVFLVALPFIYWYFDPGLNEEEIVKKFWPFTISSVIIAIYAYILNYKL